VAKKKRAGAAKRAGTRRKTTRRRTTTRKRTTGPSATRVDLKALRRQIEQSAARLETISTTRGINTEAVRGRLERMMADLDDLCDRNNPDGCHPTMVIPPAL
jgi:hypothetical protein